MKRNVFLTLFVLVLCATLLCACAKPNLDKLNDMAAAEYSVIKISVNTVFDDAILKSQFEIARDGSKHTVKYRVENFAQMDPENPLPSAKEVIEGVATLQNGQITDISGDNPEGRFSLSESICLRFQLEYFDNYQLTDTRFTADVADPAAFFGSQSFSGANVKVDVSFSDVLQTVQANYVSENGANVQILYEFTR